MNSIIIESDIEKFHQFVCFSVNNMMKAKQNRR